MKFLLLIIVPYAEKGEKAATNYISHNVLDLIIPCNQFFGLFVCLILHI